MALLYTTGQADYTSPRIGPIGKRAATDYYPSSVRLFLWGNFGTGSVSVEVQMPDDSWVAFDDLTFVSNTAQDIALFPGASIRVVVAGATSVNIMVDN